MKQVDILIRNVISMKMKFSCQFSIQCPLMNLTGHGTNSDQFPLAFFQKYSYTLLSAAVSPPKNLIPLLTCIDKSKGQEDLIHSQIEYHISSHNIVIKSFFMEHKSCLLWLKSELINWRNASPILNMRWWPKRSWNFNTASDCTFCFDGLQILV